MTNRETVLAFINDHVADAGYEARYQAALAALEQLREDAIPRETLMTASEACEIVKEAIIHPRPNDNQSCVNALAALEEMRSQIPELYLCNKCGWSGYTSYHAGCGYNAYKIREKGGDSPRPSDHNPIPEGRSDAPAVDYCESDDVAVLLRREEQNTAGASAELPAIDNLRAALARLTVPRDKR